MPDSVKHRTRKAVKVSEASVLRAVTEFLDHLANMGRLMFFRHHPVRIVGGGDAPIIFTKVPERQRGVADIIIVMGSAVYGAELKGSDKDQSDDQRRWQAAFVKQGGRYAVVRDIDDLLLLLGLTGIRVEG